MENEAGKIFRPQRFGPRPIPSAQFCYDNHNCKAWFDCWLARGGSIARDTVYLQRAHDLPDLRSFEDKLVYSRIETKLHARRGLLRRSSLAQELRAAKSAVKSNVIVPFRRP